MRTNLKKIVGNAAIGLALLANTAPTWAGQALISEVKIGDVWASGALQATRNSSDQTQFIRCLDRSYDFYGPGDVYCTAKDIYGAQHTCSSTDPKMKAVVRTMTDHSFIHFTWHYNKPDKCYFLRIDNSSTGLR